MLQRGTKRPRPSDHGVTEEPSFQQMVDALDEKTVRSTLVRLASMAPSAQILIKQAYTQRLQVAGSKDGNSLMPSDFDHYSKKAWHALHTSDAARGWATLDEASRAGATERALQTVIGCVREIRSQFQESTPFDVKLNALEVIRKILKSILLGSNQLAVSVRNALASNEELGEHIILIVFSMTSEELIRAGGTADEKGTLCQKFKWCEDEATKCGLRASEGLGQVVEMMTAPTESRRSL